MHRKFSKRWGIIPKSLPFEPFFWPPFCCQIKNGNFVVICNYVKIHGLHLCKKPFIYNFIELNKSNGIFQFNITIIFLGGEFLPDGKILPKNNILSNIPFSSKQKIAKNWKKIWNFAMFLLHIVQASSQDIKGF